MAAANASVAHGAHGAAAAICVVNAPDDHLSMAAIAHMLGELRQLPVATSEGECIERIKLFEEAKGVFAAAQARETIGLDSLRRKAEAAAGIPLERRGKGVADEVALARRESPSMGSRALGLARALVSDMPHAMEALSEGTISEFTASVIVKEVAQLPADSRRAVDKALAGRYGQVSTGRLGGEARALAAQADPATTVERNRRAVRERHVSLRPAPDSMANLTALLPMVQAVACMKSLNKAAVTDVATGAAEGRTRAQVMADLLVERVTGQSSAPAVPVEVQLLITDTALFGTNRRTFKQSEGDEPLGAVGIPRLKRVPESFPETSVGPSSLGDGSGKDFSSDEGSLDGPVTSESTECASGAGSQAAVRRSLDVQDAAAVPGGGEVFDSGLTNHRAGHDQLSADPREEAAWLVGFGPLSAGIAREFLRAADDAQTFEVGELLEAAGNTEVDRQKESGELFQTGESSEVVAQVETGGRNAKIGSASSSNQEQQQGEKAKSKRGARNEPTPRVFLRRVFADPETGEFRGMDSRRRVFSGNLRRALILRDDRCRTPWCGAPILHLDHASPVNAGGTTSYENAAGLCARCNYIKETSGRTAEMDDGKLSVQTPTGHTYTSEPPRRPHFDQPRVVEAHHEAPPFMRRE